MGFAQVLYGQLLLLPTWTTQLVCIDELAKLIIVIHFNSLHMSTSASAARDGSDNVLARNCTSLRMC